MSGLLLAVWRHHGTPGVQTRPASGLCMLCGQPAAHDHRDVLSANFGDWDRLAWRASGALCTPCAWGYQHRPLRTWPHDESGRLDPRRLSAALAGLGPTGYVCVPVGGKRHLAPYARPGLVSTDAGHLPWTGQDTTRLAVYTRLRAAGFGETALVERAPPWPLLTRVPQRAAVLADWPLLDPWRHLPGYLDVAARATRTPKETP